MIALYLLACTRAPSHEPFLLQGVMDRVSAWDVGDVTGDGHADLISAATVRADGLPEVRVYAGPWSGPGSPVPLWTVVIDGAWSEIRDLQVVGDVDGDAIPDIVVGVGEVGFTTSTGDYVGGTRIIHGGEQAGEVEVLGEDANRSRFPMHGPVGDVDGNGLADMVVAWPRDESMRLERISVATVPAESDVAVNGLFSVGDLDGDGTTDVLVGTWSMAGVVRTGRWSDGAALGDLGGRYLADELTTWFATGADIDADGNGELILAHPHFTGAICWIEEPLLEGTSSFPTGVCWSPRHASHGAAVVPDLDGDGLAELVMSFFPSTETGATYMLTGAQVLAGDELTDARMVLDGRWAYPKAVDATGDGTIELVFRGTDGVLVVPSQALVAD